MTGNAYSRCPFGHFTAFHATSTEKRLKPHSFRNRFTFSHSPPPSHSKACARRERNASPPPSRKFSPRYSNVRASSSVCGLVRLTLYDFPFRRAWCLHSLALGRDDSEKPNPIPQRARTRAPLTRARAGSSHARLLPVSPPRKKKKRKLFRLCPPSHPFASFLFSLTN